VKDERFERTEDGNKQRSKRVDVREQKAERPKQAKHRESRSGSIEEGSE
jgi:hypothetical protein